MVYLAEKNRIPSTAIQNLIDRLLDPEYPLRELPVDAAVAQQMASINRDDVPIRRAGDQQGPKDPSVKNSNDLVAGHSLKESETTAATGRIGTDPISRISQRAVMGLIHAAVWHVGLWQTLRFAPILCSLEIRPVFSWH